MTSPVRVDYVELSVSSGPRTKTFYETAFGWNFEDWGRDGLVVVADGPR
jgi:predicted enzyme related to lactoylglutathione lyase